MELFARLQTILSLNRYHRIAEQQMELEKLNSEVLAVYDATIEGWSEALRRAYNPRSNPVPHFLAQQGAGNHLADSGKLSANDREASFGRPFLLQADIFNHPQRLRTLPSEIRDRHEEVRIALADIGPEDHTFRSRLRKSISRQE